MNIVVLYGGFSAERDVSLSGGSLIAKALQEKGHNIILLDSYMGYQGTKTPTELFSENAPIEIIKVAEIEPNLEKVKASRHQKNNESVLGENVIEICLAADITFFALHGEDGENGKLQAVFDVYGIKYTGSGYLGSALAMNKTLSKNIFSQHGVLTPKGITVYKGELPYKNVGFPCVVKPCSGGSSVATFIVNNLEEYEAALPQAFIYEKAVIVEEYVKGRELTCGVIDGHGMPIVEIEPKCGFYDYKNKYQAGATIETCPANLSEEITAKVKHLSEKVSEILMCEAYCRVDFLMDKDNNLYCLEANSLPGMTPTSLVPQMAAAEGISYGDLCETLIRASLKKYE